jgi:uncharacterized membrane protein
MLRYLIQVIENLLATGILTAMLWAILGSEGGDEGEARRKRGALWASVAGASAALVIAVLRRTTALINRGFFNTTALTAAIAGGVLYIVFLWKSPQKSADSPRPGRIYDYARRLLMAALLLYALPVIFLYPTEFVLAGESAFSTDFLAKLAGFAAGLAVVVMAALAVYRTAALLSAAALKATVTAALAVSMCGHAVVIVQFLLARRIIPMSRWLFSLIIVAVNNNIVFLYAVMALSFLPALILLVRGLRQPVSGRNPAERRKMMAARRTARRWCAAAAVCFAVSVLAVTVVKEYSERPVELSPAEPMTIAGDEILIPITQIEDGHLHRFEYAAEDGTGVRFIVIKKSAAAYGVGLDACDICGPTGYYERKGQVICRLCDVVMNISTIGFKGGCNPVPLAYSLRSGMMVIETADLENEKHRFK